MKGQRVTAGRGGAPKGGGSSYKGQTGLTDDVGSFQGTSSKKGREEVHRSLGKGGDLRTLDPAPW